MATARKLPSGFWRCQVFIHYEIVLDKNGKPVIDPKTKKQKQKRIYKSFTCDAPSARGKRKCRFFSQRLELCGAVKSVHCRSS